MAESDARAQLESRVGKTLRGKWRLDHLIGIGGMAAVYAASHRNGAVAAIKILHADYARRADARTRFLREAYIANKVGDGAVRVIDDDVDDDGSPYLVMDLLHGEPVEARAQRMGGKLPLQEVLWITSEVLPTLQRAHEQGIVHRDLKPENLFWTTQQTVRVLDFGVARLRDATTTETTRTGTVLGTPMFMAPEQALGVVSEIDARTDIWSLGAIMFRLLTGHHVHGGTRPPTLITAATRRARAIAGVDATIPPDVAAIVDTALKFDRGDRFPSARAMLQAVEKAQTPTPAPAPRFTAPTDAIPSAAPAAEASSPDRNETGLATGMSYQDSVALYKIMRLIQDALQERASRGPSGATAIGKLGEAYRAVVEALATAHIGLFWNVVPEGFVAREQFVWMPKPPSPRTPEQLYSGGVRMLGMLPGITQVEFELMVRILEGDVAPFADFATFLHSSQLDNVVYRIDPTTPGKPEHESISIEPSSTGGVATMLKALQESEDGALRVTLLSRLERWGAGHEQEVVKVLETAEVELAMGLLRVLAVTATPAAREAMEAATHNPNAIVRIQALSSLHEDERLDDALRAAFEADDPHARCAALVNIEKYKIAAAAPALGLHIRAESFDRLLVEEKRQALAALAAIAPKRAEAVSVQLLAGEAEASSADHEATRALAAELLARIGESDRAREALEGAATDRRPEGQAVRAAALRALDTFEANQWRFREG